MTRVEDVADCVALDVDYVGFNLVTGSRRQLDAGTAARLWRTAARAGGSGATKPVAVLADPAPAAVAALLAVFPELAALQLHGKETAAQVQAVRDAAGGRAVWKAAGVRGEADVAAAGVYAGAADLVLLDAAAKAPGAAVEGGSGQSFDWAWLEAWRGAVPLGVAGGVRPGSLARLAQQAPALALIDVCSGVERALGVKDREKLAALCQERGTVW